MVELKDNGFYTNVGRHRCRCEFCNSSMRQSYVQGICLCQPVDVCILEFFLNPIKYWVTVGLN